MKKRIQSIIACLSDSSLENKGDGTCQQTINLLLAENHISKDELIETLRAVEVMPIEQIDKKLHFVYIEYCKQFLDHLIIKDSEQKSAEYLRSLFGIKENAILTHKNNRYLVEELVMSQHHLISLDKRIDYDEHELRSRTLSILDITTEKYDKIIAKLIDLEK